jgi:hypothetical protein
MATSGQQGFSEMLQVLKGFFALAFAVGLLATAAWLSIDLLRLDRAQRVGGFIRALRMRRPDPVTYLLSTAYMRSWIAAASAPASAAICLIGTALAGSSPVEWCSC